MSIILPETAPPAWADRSVVEDGGIWHTLELGSVLAPPERLGGPSSEVGVTLNRHDLVDVTPEGVQVTPGPPEVYVGDSRMPLASAAALAALVVSAVDLARGGAR